MPSVVAGTSGAIVAGALADISASHALLATMAASFMLAVGLLMSFFILAIYTHRLLLHGFPSAGKLVGLVYGKWVDWLTAVSDFTRSGS